MWSAVAGIMMPLRSAAAAAKPAAAARLPALIRQDAKDLDYWCSRFGGLPPSDTAYVRRVELTGDGRPDYIVDLGHYLCKKHEAFMDGGHNGLRVRIYVGGARQAAYLAYDGYSHGVKVSHTRGRSRIWLRVGALACGQPPEPTRVFAAWWFCLRPLQWNGRTKRFGFAPLSEVRDVARPKKVAQRGFR